MEQVYQRREPDRRRCVLDTNVVLDWLVFNDPATRTLGNRIESGAWQLLTRADVRAELAHVLAYPALNLAVARRAEVLDRYDRYALAWEAEAGPAPVASAVSAPANTAVPLPLCRDPSDQKFLILARDAGADWLVTRDLRVLRLARRCAELGLFRIVPPAGLDAPEAAAPL